MAVILGGHARRDPSFSRLGPLQIQPLSSLPEILSSELALSGDLTSLAILGHPADPIGFTTRVRRSLPSLWRMELPSESGLGNLRVEYELVAANGGPGRLSLERDPQSEILVSLEEIPPVIIEHTRDSVTVEGGVILDLDVVHAHMAGDYHGTLTVTIHQL